jgi:hypothetical protein
LQKFELFLLIKTIITSNILKVSSKKKAQNRNGY